MKPEALALLEQLTDQHLAQAQARVAWAEAEAEVARWQAEAFAASERADAAKLAIAQLQQQLEALLAG
jgi:hypothetical protein